MNQVTLNRGAPRTSLLAAAVLSSLAMADTPDAKKALVHVPPTPLMDDAAKKLSIGPVKNGLVIQLNARTNLAGTSVTAKKPYAKTTTGTKLFGKNGLVVAHHYEPHGCAGKMHRHEHLLVH